MQNGISAQRIDQILYSTGRIPGEIPMRAKSREDKRVQLRTAQSLGCHK